MESSSGIFHPVELLRDGSNVEAAVLNRPLEDLIDRTNYLNERINSALQAGSMSSVVLDATFPSSDTPGVGDVVCLDQSTGLFVKAVAASAYGLASDKRFAIGVVVDKENAENGVRGSVVAYGKAALPSGFMRGSESGVYFLSQTEPGAVTAQPGVPKVQVGVFVFSEENGERKAVAYVCPQYGDAMSHGHEARRLYTRPCGAPSTSVSSDGSPFGMVDVLGYPPDYIRSAGRDDGCKFPRLRVSGTWSGREDTYSLSISDGEGGVPSGFPFVLSWSSDGSSGSEDVPGFYTPVSVGNSGLEVSFEPYDRSDLNTVLYVDDGRSLEPLCKWTLALPRDGRGWESNSVYSTSEGAPAAVYGRSDSSVEKVLVQFPEHVFELPQSKPSSGDILSIDGRDVFRFVGVDDQAPVDGVRDVVIAGSAYDTYAKIAGAVPGGGMVVVDRSYGKVYCGASTVSVGSQVRENGQTTALGPSTSSSLWTLVSDGEGNSLSAGGGALELKSSGSGVALSNGLMIAVPAPATVGRSSEVFEFDVATGCPGAAFRYCIGFDQALNASYPPVPASSAALMFNGVELEQDAFFGGRAAYSVGPDTIYWCNGLEPWTPWTPFYDGDYDDVPPEMENRMVFHSVSQVGSETGPVTSIRPARGSALKITRCGTGDSASVGDLEIDVGVSMEVGDGETAGYKAVKTSRNGRLVLGPMVERIVPGPGIVIASGANQPYGQGTVTISASNAMYSGDMDTIALENAKEEMVGMFPYIRLLGWSKGARNVDTGFVAKFHVPTGIADAVYRVRLYATVFGESSFSSSESQLMAGVGLSYSILPEWSTSSVGGGRESFNVQTDRIEPDDERSVDIPFGHVSDNGTPMYSYTAFDPIVVHNDASLDDRYGRSAKALGSAFPDETECSKYLSSHVLATSSFGVRPGYVVAVRFRRKEALSANQYEGRLGFMNLRWELVRADENADDEMSTAEELSSKDAILLASRLAEFSRRVNSNALSTVYSLKALLLDLVAQLR